MAKKRNLKYQFKSVIDRNFKEGMDKHSLKRQGKDNSRIFSYSDRKNLIDVSANFCNWMRENHADIKEIKDIQTYHIQEFLNSKANCSSQTLATYTSYFRKLETLCNNTYVSANVDFHSVVPPISQKNGGGKIRNIMCSDEQYNQLMQTSNQNLKNAMVLSRHFGLRASECSKAKYSDIKADSIYVADSKGKRSRYVKAENQQQREILKQFRESGQQGRICAVQTGSLQQAFNRECKKQGIKFENGAFHTLRKAFATEKYKEYRKSGLTVQQSLNKVSHGLGHGDNRTELLKNYVCCELN